MGVKSECKLALGDEGEVGVMVGEVSETEIKVAVAVKFESCRTCAQPVTILIIIPTRKKINCLLLVRVLLYSLFLVVFFLKTNILVLQLYDHHSYFVAQQHG